ncbi:MAG: methyltransferase [Bacteroidales bacterium]|nr:methyltransferase [Bacteroidales bacterium]
MANDYFKFKQFTVNQDKSAMKVGTDGVLLGAWANLSEAEQILDIGTGTGLIALMAAQRSNAKIEAVEIEPGASNQAKDNVAASKWGDRINVVNADINDYKPELRFDHIISNPPFFEDSMPSPSGDRTQARHNTSLTFEELVIKVSLLMEPFGVFSVILPFDSYRAFNVKCKLNGLYPSRITTVIPKPGKEPKRVMLEYTKSTLEVLKDELTVELDNRHEYSEEYKSLTKEFYLDF